MKKFTFIAEFKNGTYISQYKADNLMEAVLIWADNLDVQFFTNKVKTKIQEKVRDSFYSPVSIEEVDNVWCSSYVYNYLYTFYPDMKPKYFHVRVFFSWLILKQIRVDSTNMQGTHNIIRICWSTLPVTFRTFSMKHPED